MKDRIKKIRKSLDLTQQEFADRLGIKQNTVATYEMGRTNPSDQAVNSICREFSVNRDYIMNGTEPMFIERSKDEQIAAWIGSIQMDADDSFKKKLIAGLANMDEAGWVALEKLIDSIQKKD